MAHAIFSQTLQVNNYFRFNPVSPGEKPDDVTVLVAILVEEK